jgi:phosphatidate phosphatase APP1
MADEYENLLYGRRGESDDPRQRRRLGLLGRLRRRSPELRIEAYHGYGTAERLFIKGRVLRDPGPRSVDANSSALRNLDNMLRRALTDEVPHAPVRARFGGAEAEAQADKEGYFGIALPLLGGALAAGWHDVALEPLDSDGRSAAAAPTTARVLVPPADAQFGVVSDIDDTVVRTESTSLLRMLRIVLLTNAHSRIPFPHVDSLYRALAAGGDGRRQNPIFYLSSSPWNLYDLLEEFMRVHDIPEGPLFLRDWNMSPRRLLGGHHDHKIVRLRHLFRVYPELPWVLIGDSGQEDPEIYRDVAREHPGRVRAIYIRNVVSGKRAAEVNRIRDDARSFGVPLLLVEDKSEVAVHAAGLGLITSAALARIRAIDEDAEPEPGVLEKIVNPDAR